MKNLVIAALLVYRAGWPAFSQSAGPPAKFLAADIHSSAKVPNPFFRTAPVQNGRYQLTNATMVDLIHTAYGFDPDKVLAGPNWLEMNRYDIVAKAPADSTPDSRKQMLQTLLEERFKLVVHKDTKPLPTYALVLAGKKPQLKEATTGDPGCKPQTASGPPEQGGIRLMMSMNGTPMTLSLGPGMTITYECRNMTMASFADNLHTMLGANVGTNPILDQTGLEGRWNFDVRWSMGIIGPMVQQGDRITVFEALEKQLGLKLEERQVPTPVIVVDSVNARPTDNPPDTATILPNTPPPTEFDVASVKPSDPSGRGGRIQTLPGGRFVSEGMPMRFLVARAFNMTFNMSIVGLPSWADTERFDIQAKAPATGPDSPPIDDSAAAPMLLNLLKERFKLAYHSEERPVTAYTLTAVKPKMKKADPNSRTFCKFPPPTAGTPSGSRVLQCQNVTMEQFADRLQNLTSELNWPVTDTTGLQGGWDLTLTFSIAMAMPPAPPRGGDAGAAPSAAEPTPGVTLFEAVEKQLGLKLVAQKRPMPVIVIDHIEQKPTDN